MTVTRLTIAAPSESHSSFDIADLSVMTGGANSESAATEPLLLNARALFDHSPQPMWVFDQETLHFLAVNEAAVLKYGYSRDEFLTLSLIDIRPLEERERLRSRIAALRNHTESSGGWWHQCKDGTLLFVEVISYTLQFGGRPARVATVFDVTARRQAEEALHQSRQRLALHLQHTPLAFIEWDAERRVVEWNPAAERIFGFTRDEVIGRPVSEWLVPPEAQAHVERRWKALLHGGAAGLGGIRSDNENRNRGGDALFCSWYNTPLVNEQGEVFGVASVVEDKTRQWQAIAAVHESEMRARESEARAWLSESRLARIAATVPGMMYQFVMREGTTRENFHEPGRCYFTYASEGSRDLLGVFASDVTSGHWQLARAIEPDDLEAWIEKVFLSAANLTRCQWESRFRHAETGHLLWISSDSMPEILPHGGGTRWSGYFKDVTAQREAQERLRHLVIGARCLLWEATVRRPAAAPSVPGAIPDYEWEGFFPFDTQTRDFLPIEIRPGETLGSALYRSHPPEERRRMDANFHEAVESGAPGYSQEYTCQCMDGTERRVFEQVRLHTVAPRVWRAIAVCVDVTDQRRMEQILLQTEKMASLGGLVAGIAHELNNPLAAASGHAQLLALHPDSAVRDDAQAVRRAVDRASRLLRSLLTFARQGGDTASSDGEGSSDAIAGLSASRQPVTVLSLLETCEDLVRVRLRQADIELRFEQGPGVEAAVLHVNGTQIEQVLVNLLTNAEHALRTLPSESPRRVVVRSAVEHRDVSTGEVQVLLRVSDNGPGVPASVAGRIFDPFFTTKGVGEGTGLGLSICHGILAAHRGSIVLEPSAVGSGAVFTLRLPAQIATFGSDALPVASPDEAAEEAEEQERLA